MLTVPQLVSNQCQSQDRPRYWVGRFNSTKQCYPTYIFNTQPEAILKKKPTVGNWLHWLYLLFHKQDKKGCSAQIVSSEWDPCGILCPLHPSLRAVRFVPPTTMQMAFSVRWRSSLKRPMSNTYIVYKCILLHRDVKYKLYISTYCWAVILNTHIVHKHILMCRDAVRKSQKAANLIERHFKLKPDFEWLNNRGTRSTSYWWEQIEKRLNSQTSKCADYEITIKRRLES